MATEIRRQIREWKASRDGMVDTPEFLRRVYKLVDANGPARYQVHIHPLTFDELLHERSVLIFPHTYGGVDIVRNAGIEYGDIHLFDLLDPDTRQDSLPDQ